jgi:hypothetical protein
MLQSNYVDLHAVHEYRAGQRRRSVMSGGIARPSMSCLSMEGAAAALWVEEYVRICDLAQIPGWFRGLQGCHLPRQSRPESLSHAVYNIIAEGDHEHEDLNQSTGEQRLKDGPGRTSIGGNRKISCGQRKT